MSGLLRLTSPLLTRVRRATAAPSPGRHAARRSPARPRAVASDASTGSDGAATAPLSRSEVIVTSTAVRLASYVYKAGDLEPWVSRDGFVLRAQGVTPCTRWFVCDKIEPAGDAKQRAEAATPAGDSSAAPALSSSPSGASASSRDDAPPADRQSADADSDSDSESERGGGVVTQRWFIVRGAAWNDDAVDSLQLSANIAKMWPAPLHPAVPVVCHAGVSEMTEAFWPEIAPLAASAPATARLCFAGHSLGGSMATLLMAWTKLRLGVDPARMDPAITFGSPPTLAVDRWALRNADAGASVARVARAAAGGAVWVGELMLAVGVGELTGGIVGGITPAGGGGAGGAGANESERGTGERGTSGWGLLRRRRGLRRLGGLESSWNGIVPGAGNRGALALAGFAPTRFARSCCRTTPCLGCGSRRTPRSAPRSTATWRGASSARASASGAGIFSSRRFVRGGGRAVLAQVVRQRGHRADGARRGVGGARGELGSRRRGERRERGVQGRVGSQRAKLRRRRAVDRAQDLVNSTSRSL